MAKRTTRGVPKSLKNEMDLAVDRRLERWARRLRIDDGGKVRKLTEQEVQVALGRKAPRGTRRSATTKAMTKGRGR